jgi:tetraacyldisaccharide 4'-kinase
MKTPSFWRTKNILSTALLPFSWLYALGVWLRNFEAKPQTLPVPVICIGNLTAGGSGKTPTAIAIGERLKSKNINAYFLSRGYGGSLPGPVLVNPHIHSAREVGDEPLLLARSLPTVIAKDRLAGAMFAIHQGAPAIIMDDGFQNPAIAKTLSLLVIDGHYVFGNGRLLPAGPLRETPASGLARADAAIVVGGQAPVLPASLPVIRAHIEPAEFAKSLAGKTVFAFCGMAFPEKFFATLESLGAHIAGRKTFADHYLYSSHDLKALTAAAKRHHAMLVTTAKDAARLHADWRALVTVVDISLNFDKPDVLDTLLTKALT